MSAEKYYDALANLYDAATAPEGAWMSPLYIATEVTRLETTPASALIIGVGTGLDIPPLLAKKIPHIEAIDISGNMIATAHAKFPKLSYHHADFMKHENFKLPCYDLIICSGTLEFLADFLGFFQKASCLLSQDGTLLVTYEPLIAGHKVQQDMHSTQLSERIAELKNLPLTTYRHTITDLLTACGVSGLTLTKHFEYISYRKMDADMIYHFARLEKANL
jgi:predicted TPR repeat methyltransferase